MHIAESTASVQAVSASPLMGEAAPVRSTRAPGRIGTKRRLDKDETIFAEGDRAACYYKIVSGAVRSYKLLSDGRRQIHAFHLPGDVFGLVSGKKYRSNAEALSRTTIIAYQRLTPDGLATIGEDLVTALMLSLERAQRHALLLGRKSAVERIATFLLDMARRMPECEIDLPMCRNDIADHLGMTIETVSRSLTQLERDRLIELPSGRRSIRLRDRTALERLEA